MAPRTALYIAPFGALSFAVFKDGPIDLFLCDFYVGSLVDEVVGEERVKNPFGSQVELDKAQARNAAKFRINRFEVEHLAA